MSVFYIKKLNLSVWAWVVINGWLGTRVGSRLFTLSHIFLVFEPCEYVSHCKSSFKNHVCGFLDFKKIDLFLVLFLHAFNKIVVSNLFKRMPVWGRGLGNWVEKVKELRGTDW